MASETDLRRDARAILGRPISADVWRTLKRSGQVRLALTMETGAQDLADAVPDVEMEIELERAEEGTAPRPRRNGPRFWRTASEVLAELARQDQDPEGFRQHLGLSKPLALEASVEWIRLQSAASAPRWSADAELHREDADWSRTQLMLHYVVPGQRFAPQLPCRAGGSREEPLDQLALRSAALADRYGWSEAHATAFLLCDFTPWAVPIQISWSRQLFSVRRPPFITLRVDPRVAAEDVSNAYRTARARLVADTGRKKPQPQQEIGLELGLFALRSSDGETTADTLSRWNHAHPEHKRPLTSAGVSNFARDLHKAAARAVGADWL